MRVISIKCLLGLDSFKPQAVASIYAASACGFLVRGKGIFFIHIEKMRGK
jgi:hypothetical protein